MLGCAPGWEYPSIVTGSVISGSCEVGDIVYPSSPPFVKSAVPVSANSIVSVPEPAAHSPVAAPETVSVFAAVIASLSVQAPSLAVVSAVEFTVMVLAACTLLPEITLSVRANRKTAATL